MRIPVPPQTFVSRQLTCICCQQPFTIAVDLPHAMNGRTNSWHIPVNNLYHVELPPQPVADQRPIHPIAAATVLPELPSQTAVSRPFGHDQQIFCPRCGSDNSNWLYLQQQRPFRYHKWALFLGLTFAVGLLFWLLFDQQSTKNQLLVAISLAIACYWPLGLASKWQKIDTHNQLANILAEPGLTLLKPYQQLLIVWATCALLLPALVYVVPPFVRDFMQLAWEILTAVPATIAPPASTAVNVAPVSPPPPNINWPFLFNWFVALSLTAFASGTLSLALLQAQISQLAAHLPKPIFTNLSQMRQLAIWEANQALAIGPALSRIQWTQAQRNGRGGIDMVGLFRDPPEFDTHGRLPNQVRAQQYFISTDPWCRLIEARISDKMVSRPAGGPSYAWPETATAVAVSRLPYEHTVSR